MKFWQGFKLVLSGFVTGLLLLLGLHVFRKKHPTGQHDDLEQQWQKVEQEHKDKLEELQNNINNKPLEDKMEEMDEKATQSAPWSGVNIIIPSNFRTTRPGSTGTSAS